MIYPKFIKEGNTIGVPAPSNGAYEELDINRYKNAKEKIEKMGYKVKLSKNAFKSEKCRSAKAQTRAKELNEMFESEDIDFIWCASRRRVFGRNFAICRF